MNLDGIKYIFQIPLAWFRQVGAFVFNSYGGNLVQIRRNVDGSAEFLVDPNELKQQAQEGLAEKFVTLDTTQTLTATKTWTGQTGVAVKSNDNHTLTIRGAATTVAAYLDTTSKAVFSTSSTTLRIGVGLTVVLGHTSSSSITLGKQPTDSTSTTSLAIASLGWVNNHFFRPSTSSTGLVYNTNGTISYKTIGTGANDVAAGQHTHTASDITDLPSGFAPYTSTPAALSENGSAGSSNLYSRGDHSHPYPDLTDLPCTISGHTGTCLLIVQDDGSVTHSGNEMYNNCKALSDGYQAGSVTIQSHADGASANKTVIRSGAIELYSGAPYIDFHFDNSSADFTSRIIEWASGHLWLNNHPTDTDLDTSTTSPVSTPALQVATCGFVNGKVKASDPGSTNIQTMPASGLEDSTTALQDTWTAGGTNGLVRTVLYRQVFDASATPPVIYNFYRKETLDKFGRVYKVSGETRKVLDTTNLITLS